MQRPDEFATSQWIRKLKESRWELPELNSMEMQPAPYV